ncbi:MAG: hypothetical protein JSS81_00020 [Acidobacteria bacterium]|nr:hypothetical protein [Acidobacteriota bacterium]
MASRKEQSASHTPSFVSAVFVTVKIAAGLLNDHFRISFDSLGLPGRSNPKIERKFAYAELV